jgi:hypothetical protein
MNRVAMPRCEWKKVPRELASSSQHSLTEPLSHERRPRNSETGYAHDFFSLGMRRRAAEATGSCPMFQGSALAQELHAELMPANRSDGLEDVLVCENGPSPLVGGWGSVARSGFAISV